MVSAITNRDRLTLERIAFNTGSVCIWAVPLLFKASNRVASEGFRKVPRMPKVLLGVGWEFVNDEFGEKILFIFFYQIRR